MNFREAMLIFQPLLSSPPAFQSQPRKNQPQPMDAADLQGSAFMRTDRDDVPRGIRGLEISQYRPEEFVMPPMTESRRTGVRPY